MAMYYQHCYDPQMNRYDPYSNNYNSQWEEYSNTFYGGNQYVKPNYDSQSEYNEFAPQYSDPSNGDLINALNDSNIQLQQMSEQAYGPFPQQPPIGMPQDQEPSISDMLKTLVASTMQTQVILQSTEASLKNLESTMGQIATSLNNLEVESIGELPTKLESNPIENDGTLTLKSGPQLDTPPHPDITFNLIPTQEVNNSTQEASSPPEIETFTSVGPSSQNMLHKPTVRLYVPIPPFPSRMTKFKNEEENKVILKINISLLKTIKQVPPYAKLPKELSSNKSVRENVSIILQRKLPPKCQDLGMFINPYTIRLLKETSGIIQLANHTNAYPLRVVEDALVQVQFGRPFLLITSTKMDVKVWVLTIEFEGEFIQFDMLNSIDKFKRKKVLLNDPP
ncbi:uncharacterized protein LOC133779786 [Humulus lupulus]|uniref:uncharacterized protein LOC133779786 n=1 Tax=Humulus lupulus TaxID=3486 RepID=UPI002B415E7D|nr:uncharacterized protein LOC133779786 [Humulus lupulus]